MGEEYVNRKGDRYYLFQGKTKTGKPKYFCSRKPAASGTRVDTMPEGYEWRENPADGTVSVRKVRPTRIAPFEREMLAQAIRSQAGLEAFLVDIAEDSLVVYLPNRDPDDVAALFGTLLGAPAMEEMKDWTMQHAPYCAMLRFVLRDADERLFSVERWCFRGSIDAWIDLAGAAPLEKQIRKYVPHLGRESFYDLI